LGCSKWGAFLLGEKAGLQQSFARATEKFYGFWAEVQANG